MNSRRVNESLRRNYLHLIEQCNELLYHIGFFRWISVYSLRDAANLLFEIEFIWGWLVRLFPRLLLPLAVYTFFFCNFDCILAINEIEECGFVLLNVCGRRQKGQVWWISWKLKNSRTKTCWWKFRLVINRFFNRFFNRKRMLMKTRLLKKFN